MFKMKIYKKFTVLCSACIVVVLIYFHLAQQPEGHRLSGLIPNARNFPASPNDSSLSTARFIRSFHESVSPSRGEMLSFNNGEWQYLKCDRKRKLRQVSLLSPRGNFTFYVYDSAEEDPTVTARALEGRMFEQSQIEKFLQVSRDLPLIDIGANVGLVSLQAAMQGRQVVAVDAIPENALRLCRSAVDFHDASLVRVVNNAVSSTEGNIMLSSGSRNKSTLFHVSSMKTASSTEVYAILSDHLLEVVPFRTAALKIDVESHEGHVIDGACRLFSELDIRMVWMEWYHVKKLSAFGPLPIITFMKRHGMAPYSLMSGTPLSGNYMEWPFTVLWRKTRPHP